MNIRLGFKRLAQGFLALCWGIWGIVTVIDQPGAAEVGRTFGMLLMFTLGFLIFCKMVAWIFNGFFAPPPSR